MYGCGCVVMNVYIHCFTPYIALCIVLSVCTALCYYSWWQHWYWNCSSLAPTHWQVKALSHVDRRSGGSNSQPVILAVAAAVLLVAAAVKPCLHRLHSESSSSLSSPWQCLHRMCPDAVLKRHFGLWDSLKLKCIYSARRAWDRRLNNTAVATCFSSGNCFCNISGSSVAVSWLSLSY